jgi:SAM-dependent methyltransferase
MKHLIPWWSKITAKIILARLPISYDFWKKLRLFEHGDMNRPERAWETFNLHTRLAGVLDESSSHIAFSGRKVEPFNVLELGPGDSLFSGLIARALGADGTWLVDTGSWAMKDFQQYCAMRQYLLNKGLPIADLDQCQNVDDLLSLVSTSYLTDGVRSLAHIPTASIDFCFSNAVLEHVDKSDFPSVVRELFRVLKPCGASSHRVDLKDHLGGGLNNLRFSENRWEGNLFKSSGFYTNRIRFTDMTDMFRREGFEVSCPRVLRWNSLPIQRSKLNSAFRNLPDEELLVSGFDMILKKPA